MKTGSKTVVLMLVVWLTCVWQTAAGEVFLPEELQNLYARSAVVIDGSSGRVLFGKNTEEVMPMASTTKIMTCILALEECNMDETAKASEKAAAQPEVHLGVSEGETFRLEDLLYALMLESYNDAAVIIAEHVSGSVEDFAAAMNKKAAELGCTDTHFVTPNGLDGEDGGGAHRTTAKELAHIMKYCAWDSDKAEEFRKITGTRQYSFTNLEGTKNYSCYNHNAFLDQYDGTVSGKTGFTSAAGYCYVCAVESEERKFVGVVLACGWPYNRTYKWKDMTRMMDYARLHYRNVYLENPVLREMTEVTDGWIKDMHPQKNILIPLCTEKDTKEIVLLGDYEYIIRRMEYKNTIQAPVERGMVLGKVQFLLNGEIIREMNVVADSSVERCKIRDWLVWTLQKILL